MYEIEFNFISNSWMWNLVNVETKEQIATLHSFDSIAEFIVEKDLTMKWDESDVDNVIKTRVEQLRQERSKL